MMVFTVHLKLISDNFGTCDAATEQHNCLRTEIRFQFQFKYIHRVKSENENERERKTKKEIKVITMFVH